MLNGYLISKLHGVLKCPLVSEERCAHLGVLRDRAFMGMGYFEDSVEVTCLRGPSLERFLFKSNFIARFRAFNS